LNSALVRIRDHLPPPRRRLTFCTDFRPVDFAVKRIHLHPVRHFFSRISPPLLFSPDKRPGARARARVCVCVIHTRAYAFDVLRRARRFSPSLIMIIITIPCPRAYGIRSFPFLLSLVPLSLALLFFFPRRRYASSVRSSRSKYPNRDHILRAHVD